LEKGPPRRARRCYLIDACDFPILAAYDIDVLEVGRVDRGHRRLRGLTSGIGTRPLLLLARREHAEPSKPPSLPDLKHAHLSSIRNTPGRVVQQRHGRCLRQGPVGGGSSHQVVAGAVCQDHGYVAMSNHEVHQGPRLDFANHVRACVRFVVRVLVLEVTVEIYTPSRVLVDEPIAVVVDSLPVDLVATGLPLGCLSQLHEP